ncbi:hypothetical protein GCM10011583_25540 [Streptomyces camponoticapitis]|uniref:Secreted protein n=1 Tax=Streptomyces camponoticapitis TaxID=1616125 RepID=A0ABQ2E717_9ACTN|nr:hypothetical protein GCM10011583_25540 [Streptomyces camponoticapitis]
MRLPCTGTVRRFATVIAVTALTWVFAPSAVAGGPTSVLIASPESHETAALYYSDAEYEALSKQLDAQEIQTLPDGQKKRPPAVDAAIGSRQINVTWMVHDVSPWRLDQVYPSSDPSTIWIYTSTDTQGAQSGVWHKAKQPAALHALLKNVGVMGEPRGSDGAAVPPAEDADSPAAGADAGSQDQEQTPGKRSEAAGASSAGTDGWWWAIPALGAGVVLGLVLRPLAGRLPRPPFGRGGERPGAGPRQQLLDT